MIIFNTSSVLGLEKVIEKVSGVFVTGNTAIYILVHVN